MARTIIINGTIVDPLAGSEKPGCVVIADGRITGVTDAAPSATNADTIIDASGLLVTPGFVDLHVGVREPGFEEDETIASASRSAVAGGFTSMATLPDTNPVVDNRGAAEFVKLRAQSVKGCRVFPMGAVTKGAQGEELSEIGLLVEAGAVAFSDARTPIANAEVMRRALEYTNMFDRPILHHAMVPELSEDGIMHEGFESTRLGLRGIPAAAQDIMTGRDIALSELTGGRIHIMGMTTKDAVERLRIARQRNILVSADVSPYHLLLDDSVMSGFDTMYKVNPPLRSRDHIDVLIEGLRDGTIEAISAHHQPYAIEKKAVELDAAPFGICGLETALTLCVRALIEPGYLTWARLIRCLTSSPAGILNLPHGTLAEGAAADVTLIDPNRRWVIRASEFRSRSQNTPFDGMEFTGAVVKTLVGGSVVYDRDEQ